MAYKSNGKTYTDNPLMDEIVFNCQKIINGIVVKNDVLANRSETENSLTYAEMYYIQHEDGYISFSVFPFTAELLVGFGYTDMKDVNRFLLDRELIPEDDRDALVAYCNQQFADTFEEENDYYRTLNGLPPFGTGDEYFIYLQQKDFPSKYKKNVDFRVPLHQQPKDIISILYNTGKIDQIKKDHPSSNYSYINHLGPKKIDLYTARKAAKWDILYLPNVADIVEDKFTEFYKVNREIYMNQSYQEAYSDTGDYYDELMIITLLAQTFADMVTDTPEWYIRRDIFDIRSVKYFLESYGVKFFKDIPLKFQTRIVKNLNKLIKFKSSNMNFEDIIYLITTDDNVKILKYWIFKNRLMKPDGTYVDGDTDHQKYELQFIDSPLYESFDDYVKDPIYRTYYDDFTYADKYWDGEDTHSYIRNTILDKDFTIEGTKYMSVEYRVNLGEYLFELEYFLSLVLDSKIDLEDVRIPIPSINEDIDFSLTNIFLYTIILSDCFYRQNINDSALDINRPDTTVGAEPRIDEEFYNWKKKYLPEIFVPHNNRVHAFNVNFDRAKMEDFIINGNNRRHSHWLFGASYDNVDFDNPGKDTPLTAEQYSERAKAWLDELGINEFRVPMAKYDTVLEIIDLYRHNRRCYETLIEKIKESDDQDEIATLAYIYQELYTREFDNNFYKLSDGTNAKTLADLLLDRDYILWESYMEIMNESNIETRKDQIRAILNDVVETLEYYINGDGLEYLFGFTPINSFFNIVYYIWLLINFFKSYKVTFLDPYMTYVVDNKMDPLDGTIPTHDVINEVSITNWKQDKAFTSDNVFPNPEYGFKDNASFQADAIDKYAYQDRDPFEDMDYDGIHAEDGEASNYKDLDGGIAEDLNNTPYENIDAGRSYLSGTNMHDMNGGNADEKYHEYYDIDCGEAYHEEDEIKNWRGTQQFNFDLDGGSGSPRLFKSLTIQTDVKANLVKFNVIISSKDGNKIIVHEDGLYIPDFMVDEDELRKMKEDISSLQKEIVISSSDIMAEIMNIKSFDDIKLLIGRLIEAQIYDMKYVYHEIIDGNFMRRLAIYLAGQVEYLNHLFADVSLYGWEDLDEF